MAGADGTVEAAAEVVLRARRAAQALGTGERFPWLGDAELGRRVASRLESLLKSDGINVAGIKLGADDVPGQRALGLSEPLVAPFFDVWTLSSGSCLPLSGLIEPKIECEIGFRRQRRRWRPFACIEVADSRFGWSGRGGEVLADFALNGAIIEGSGLASSEQSAFELRHNGITVVAAVASVTAALERTERLTSQLGVPCVCSGSLHPLIGLAPGEWTLEFGGGGSVSVTAEAALQEIGGS